MLRFVLQRLTAGVALLIAVATVIFVVVQSLPGDPVEMVLGGDLGSSGSTEAADRLREQLGLNEPLQERYFNYLGSILRGDLGTSLQSGAQVSDRIFDRLPNTLEIVLISVILGSVLGVALGSIAARSGKAADNAITVLAGFGIAVPSYVLGVVLILIASLNFGWFPSGGFTAFTDDPVEHIRHIILPVTTMALPIAAVTSRMARGVILTSMDQDWVRTARSLGLSEGQVFRGHVLRNSLNPVLTNVGLQLGSLLGGSVVVETIFNWPGAGSLLVNALKERDYPMVQGTVLVLAALLIVLNIVVDICYRLLDPRVEA